MYKIAIVMGSQSDEVIVEKAISVLKEFSVDFEVHVLSAHRCPEEVKDFASKARKSGFSVLIAAAGMAAHLAGAMAANTTLPVIGIPCSGGKDGIDALYSTVQMPTGIPVATVAIDGSKNAAYLALEIISLMDEKVKDELEKFREKEKEKVLEIDKQVSKKYQNLGGQQ